MNDNSRHEKWYRYLKVRAGDATKFDTEARKKSFNSIPYPTKNGKTVEFYQLELYRKIRTSHEYQVDVVTA